VHGGPERAGGAVAPVQPNHEVGKPGSRRMEALPAAAVADACVRLGLQPRTLPGLWPVLPGRTVAGPALPVRHAGSVDVFFEALQRAPAGSVLCIDNGGRLDEGCIGDLTALEAMHHGCAAILVDGAHRDTAALRELGLPVWSKGAVPFGPLAARTRAPDALEAATMGGHRVTSADLAVLDDDGAVFVPRRDAERVWSLARRIRDAEAEQARLAKAGTPLCEQFRVKDYLADPSGGFRAHLRRLGRSIEE
jgi:4-hydroxy-4-methyl-2-oxoglutarate aldolase